MSSMNTIALFEEYMKEENIPKEKIEYNLKVVNLFYYEILVPLNRELDNIDIYAFEEFTDKVDLIDKQLLGRRGIELLLETMMILTEFLKINKLIKGGKIAYYRRIFTNKDYYLDKYDNLKGKKDNVKDFIRKITKNKLSYLVTRLLEDINVRGFLTFTKVEEILDENDENEHSQTLIDILENTNMIEKKGKGYIASKRGRALLRLEPEERYSGIVYSFLYECNWNILFEEKLNINEFIAIVCSVFMKNEYLCTEENKLEKVEYPLSLTNDNLRLSILLKENTNRELFEMLFINMGIIEIKLLGDMKVYTTTKLGKNIIKLLYDENDWFRQNKLDRINILIKNKKFNILEEEIIDFIRIFGSNISMWDYLGQLYILKKSYKEAYNILSYAYESSNKRGKVAKRALSHLIICCRKLQFSGEEEKYEKKYKLIK